MVAMKKILLFAAVATMFAACTKDATKDLAPAKPIEKFYAVIGEEESRVQLNGEGKTVWTKGDKVSVFNKTTDNCSYAFTGNTGDSEGELSYVEGGTTGEAIDQIVAVYPYTSANAVSADGSMITTVIPESQKYLKESFGVGSSIMVARSNDERLSFKNVMGWVRVALTGEKTIKSITLQGNNNELIAGDVTIKSDMSVTMASNGTNILTLDCGKGVALSKQEPTYVYIAVPPQTFEKGISVAITDSNGNKAELKKSVAVTVARNHIVPMAPFDCAIKEGVSAKQIAYTTFGNEPITPKSYTGNIVSHIFESGRGVITFDTEQTSIADNAFENCALMTSITIPDGVTTIGNYAFSGCKKLASINIPDSVTQIGSYAFNDCIVLTRTYITDIAAYCKIKFGDKAFIEGRYDYYGRNLYLDDKLVTELVIPEGVTEISDYAFIGCTELTSVTIPEGVTSIGEYAFFYCTRLTNIVIPKGVTTIADNAFEYCKRLASITIPDSVTRIGNYTFRKCTSLTSVTIPDSVTRVGSYAFYWCDSLTSVKMSKNITSISMSTFQYCSNLANVNIPNGVTLISSSAFYGCRKLTNITIPGSVRSISDFAFGDCRGLTSITIPDAVTVICGSVFSGCTGLKSVTLPSKVTEIRDHAFANCTVLTNIAIPDKVRKIENSAFKGCTGLTSITIPSEVLIIYDEVFKDCTKLSSIYCKPTKCPYLGDNVFDNISSYAQIYVPSASVSAYKSADKWSNYASKIVGYNF